MVSMKNFFPDLKDPACRSARNELETSCIEYQEASMTQFSGASSIPEGSSLRVRLEDSAGMMDKKSHLHSFFKLHGEVEGVDRTKYILGCTERLKD